LSNAAQIERQTSSTQSRSRQVAALRDGARSLLTWGPTADDENRRSFANGSKQLKRLTFFGVLEYHVDLRIVKIFLIVYTPPHPCRAELAHRKSIADTIK